MDQQGKPKRSRKTAVYHDDDGNEISRGDKKRLKATKKANRERQEGVSRPDPGPLRYDSYRPQSRRPRTPKPRTKLSRQISVKAASPSFKKPALKSDITKPDNSKVPPTPLTSHQSDSSTCDIFSELPEEREPPLAEKRTDPASKASSAPSATPQLDDLDDYGLDSNYDLPQYDGHEAEDERIDDDEKVEDAVDKADDKTSGCQNL